jgi:hypothetical protein
MPCIFCRATEDLTEEHVFPAFSGANLVVPNGSCKPCNNTCSKFEQKIAGEVDTIRHIFEIQDRYGEIPKLPVTVEVQGEGAQPVEVRGRRTAEGEIELYDFVSEAKVEDGKKVRHGFFVSAEAAEKFIERSLKRGETTTELGIPKELTLQSSAEQSLWEIACNAFLVRTIRRVWLNIHQERYTRSTSQPRDWDTLSIRSSIVRNSERSRIRLPPFSQGSFFLNQKPVLYEVSIRGIR